MKVLETPQVVIDDPVVRPIIARAKTVRKQMDSTTDALKLARLQGQFDAYLVDLQDAVRAALGQHAIKVKYTVNHAGMEALVQAS